MYFPMNRWMVDRSAGWFKEFKTLFVCCFDLAFY